VAVRLTAKDILQKKTKGEKIAALTAYDYPFAKILDECGLDIVLVGDSLGMVVLGFENTLPVTMEHMLHHTGTVARAVKKAMVVGDMPFGSYDTPEKALKNATQFKEAGADAVKLEGGGKIQKQIEVLVKAGHSVMGHLGMTPQSIKEFGGYKVQGKNPEEAKTILEDALLLDRLGVFSLVLECVPRSLAAEVTSKVKCPTIGIGAGPETDGQILVLHDMLGFKSQVRPKFVRAYASLDQKIRRAVTAYCRDVAKGEFPSQQESY